MVQLLDDPKVEEALKLLRSSARNRREQLGLLINERYTDIREFMNDLINEPAQAAEKSGGEREGTMAGSVMERTKDVLQDMGEKSRNGIRKNPWAVLSGVAAGFLAVGYIIGFNTKPKK